MTVDRKRHPESRRPDAALASQHWCHLDVAYFLWSPSDSEGRMVLQYHGIMERKPKAIAAHGRAKAPPRRLSKSAVERALAWLDKRLATKH
jgi:hypothetical protein